MTPTSIDALYDAFLERLPESLRRPARGLAFRLHLAPEPGVAWSQVFGHAVTLEAPALVAEALPGVTRERIDGARRAHLLAVIGAFGTDRMEDGQATTDDTLLAVLEALRDARDHALCELYGSGARELARAADARALRAIRLERALFRRGQRVDFATYEDVSSAKQSVGMLASVALVRAAESGAANEARAHDCLLAVAIGLQLVDDVRDWEDDAKCGGAWAILLAGDAARPGSATDERHAVLVSGVLPEMLERARAHFARAAETGRALGARRITAWAERQEAECAEARIKESGSPGYAARKRQLAHWAEEVLR